MFVPSVLEEIPLLPQHRKLTSFSEQHLPLWMTEYFAWHQETRNNLNRTNWKDTKYLVMVCTKDIDSCGGISDRLKVLPFVVLQAARHKRLLFIDWEKPRPLQEFLIPPIAGQVDWRVPHWLKRQLKLEESDISYGCQDCNRKLRFQAEDRLIRLKLQAPDGCESLYAKQPDAYSTYADVFHGIFRALFMPVPRLQAKLEEQMKDHHLVPGQYAAVHLRNMYGNRIWRHPNETIALVVNGINCASTIYPGAKIYYAADDKFAVDAAREYGRQRSLPVGSLEFNEDPLHIDKVDGWENKSSVEYDDTFMDLFLLGQARCVAYGNGGYGSFGSLLSYDANCSIRYFRGRNMVRNCTWTGTDRKETPLAPPEMHFPKEMYIKPK